MSDQTADPRINIRQIPAEAKRLIPTTHLPLNYEAAKAALAECVRVDEAKEIGDRASAIAVYARQVSDKSLFDLARRIQLRAMRRLGELCESNYKARDEARQQGMTRSKVYQATRIARVPLNSFENTIEHRSPVPSPSEYFESLRAFDRTTGVRHNLGVTPRVPDPGHVHFVRMKTAIANFMRIANDVDSKDIKAMGFVEARALREQILDLMEWLDEYEKRIPPTSIDPE